MGAINLPYQIENGDGLDADKVMADLQAIITQANGLLEADNNVQVLAPPNSNVGNANSEGASAYLSRADHQHVIQGVENVTTLPVTGNFLGRLVYVTSGVNIGKLLVCTDAGANTFAPFGGVVGTAEVPIHAIEHKDGGHDPLADNTITDHMHAAKGTIFAASMAADVSPLSGTGWTNLGTDLAVTTTGIQTLGIAIQVMFQTSGGGGNPNAALRLVDVTAGSTTIWMSSVTECDAAVQTPMGGFFYYTVPAGGARTLRLQGGASTNVSGGVIARKPVGFNTETVLGPNIQAVIL